MKLPSHKTKIICTIGPACSSVEVLEEMIRNGMSVARINFSHGNPEDKRVYIRNVNEAARRTGQPVTVFADLPGIKIRIGILAKEPLMLTRGETVTLTVQDPPADPSFIPVEYKALPGSVYPGCTIYLNDGFIQLQVEEVTGPNVRCTVIVGGPLLSRKGMNLPGVHLNVDPVTERDLELIEFGINEGIDTFGISFVEKAEDIVKVKEFAKKKGASIYAIAKIERGEAIRRFDEILAVADGIMIARGDLGVETPIEDVPTIQKTLIGKSNLWGRPVITATQMLESMKANTRPTRAEVSDVANAILDGTDAVMLSEETAIGKYPVETVRMMASIAVSTERQRVSEDIADGVRMYLQENANKGKMTIGDVISGNVVAAVKALNIRYILTPTDTGGTPRRVSRFKPLSWILAFSGFEKTCRFLNLSYGVYPFLLQKQGHRWHDAILTLLDKENLVKTGDRVIITEGRFTNVPGGTDSLGIITVGQEIE